MHQRASSVRRVTANIPGKLLDEACKTAGKGITETLVQGLEMIRRTGAAGKAQRLRGKLKLDIDLEVSRERAHR